VPVSGRVRLSPCAQTRSAGVVGRLAEDVGPTPLTDDVDAEIGSRSGSGCLDEPAVDVGQRKALPHMVSVGARCGEADQVAVEPYTFVTGGVGVRGVDGQQREPAGWCRLSGCEHGVAPDERRFVERDEAVETRHGWRVGLSELRGPDAVGLLETQAVDGPVTDQSHAERFTRLAEGRQQFPLLSCGNGDLVAELAGE